MLFYSLLFLYESIVYMVYINVEFICFIINNALIFFLLIVSGLCLIYTLDEVAFIQNLVFYIQCAYRTPVGAKYINKLYILTIFVIIDMTVFCLYLFKANYQKFNK